MDDREVDGDEDEETDVEDLAGAGAGGGDGGAAGGEDNDGGGVEDTATTTFALHGAPVFAVAVHPLNSNLIASGGEDDIAYIWDSGTGETVTKLEGHEDSVVQVEFNRDGSMLAR